MGTWQPPKVAKGVVITPEDYGIVDSRCETCEGLHGNYQAMVEIYRENVGEDGLKDFMEACEYKVSKFVDAAVVANPEAFFGPNNHRGFVEVEKDRIVSSMGIGDLAPEQRLEVIQTLIQENGIKENINEYRPAEVANAVELVTNQDQE